MFSHAHKEVNQNVADNFLIEKKQREKLSIHVPCVGRLSLPRHFVSWMLYTALYTNLLE